MYQALYRKYRPKSFNEVYGQQHIVKTLKNAIKHNKVAHAYLFTGPRGTGKTTIAKIFAKSINCLNQSDDACNECEICKSINENRSVDIIEMDAASNRGVEDIREIRDKVKFLPNQCKFKVYIIDEVHMLTTEAFNALLKTLEEPPSHIIFILATTEPHKIPLTILSRCQRFDFKGIEIKEIEANIRQIAKSENIDITNDAIYAIAYNSEGGMRDALSLFDQVISFSDGKIEENDVHRVSGSVSSKHLISLVRGLIDNNPTESLSIIDKLLDDGKEIPKITNDLLTFFRNILLFKNVKSEEFYNVIFDNDEFVELSSKITNQRLYFYISIINETIESIKWTTQKRPYLELAIIKMTDKKEVKEIEKLDKIKILENKIIELEKKINSQDNISVKPLNKEEKQDLPSNILEEIIWNNDNNKKELLLKAWGKLSNWPDLRYKAIAFSLSLASLASVGNDKMLLVYEDAFLVDRMNNAENKKLVFDVLNRKSKLVKDYIAITKEQYDNILKIIENESTKGNNKPKIEFIQKKQEKNNKVDIVDEVKSFFGDEKIIID